MSHYRDNSSEDEYSVVGEKGEIGFLDFEDDRSLCDLDPFEANPVVISQPFPFICGKPHSALIGETSACQITITNTTADSIELWSVRIFSSNPEDSYTLSLMKPPLKDASEEEVRRFVGSAEMEDRVLLPNQTLTIWLSCTPKDIGMHTTIVHFDTGDEKIERVAFLLAEDKVSQALISYKPYVRANSWKSNTNFVVDQYVTGSKPKRQSVQGSRRNIPQYEIPATIRELVGSKKIPDVWMEDLWRRNYAAFFSTLLAMEEIHLEEEMRTHDMEYVRMKRRGNNFLSLVVPGLAEKRPSLVIGDYIFAKFATKISPQTYQGYIHRVEADQIFLKFDKEFHDLHHNENLYKVSFTYNRITMRRLYHSINAAEKLGPKILFPSQPSFRKLIKTSKLVPINPYINQEQARCVELILGCRGGPPYMIHGPPGTGKTMTVVEAILQIYSKNPGSHILVCASSNSAADHILEKILDSKSFEVHKSEMFRLNAPSRAYEDVNPEFAQFCFFDDMVFKCPPLRALWHYRIVISTYMSSSLLHAEGIRRGYFSHIFLDEAGQASEPETMIPLSNLAGRGTIVVLAGDPKQLGPVIYSEIAGNYGLKKSYLERLFEYETYRNNESFVTKLVRNYRCHPAILELPSDLFYNRELIACKEEKENLSGIYNWEELPNKSFPVLFFGIQGCDEREGNNPSWFNRIEVSKVIEIIRKLMRSVEVGEDDFGVITPYRQQVIKLKMALQSSEMEGVKVGSVEQFQGQEKEIIVISTVRSTIKHHEFDRTHNLGFLNNAQRFNVAITRAISLLVVVGNPHILAKDPLWDRLLRYCADNGSYMGCPLPLPEKHHNIGGYEANESEACMKSYSDEVE